METTTQLVPLSHDLVASAQIAVASGPGNVSDQIEYWAALGKLVAPVIAGAKGEQRPLSECVAAVGTAVGDQRLRAQLNSGAYPRYEAEPGGYFVRIAADGTRTRGKFLGREFRPETP